MRSDISFSSNAGQKLAFEKIIRLVDDSLQRGKTEFLHNMMANVLEKNNLASALGDFIDKIDLGRQ